MTTPNIGTLREAARQLDRNYGTLRHYAVRYKDTFPKPLTTNSRGRGITWDIDALDAWWQNHDDTKGSGGAHHHKDSSERATLGHKFRQIRQANVCTDPECGRKFVNGDEVVDVREGDTLNVLHENCYERQEQAARSSRQSDEFVA